MTVIAILVLVAFLYREYDIKQQRDAWTRERAQLLNRIKPETAQPVDGGPEPVMFQPPHFDDDEAMRELRESWN